MATASADALDLAAKLSFLEGVVGVTPGTWTRAGRGAFREIESLLGDKVKDLLRKGKNIFVDLKRFAEKQVRGIRGVEAEDFMQDALAGLTRPRPLFYDVGRGKPFTPEMLRSGNATWDMVLRAAKGYLKKMAIDLLIKEKRKKRDPGRIEKLDKGYEDKPGITRDVSSLSFSELDERDQMKVVIQALADMGNPAYSKVRDAVARIITQKVSQADRRIFDALLQDLSRSKSRTDLEIAKDLGYAKTAPISRAKKNIGKILLKEFQQHPEILDPIYRDFYLKQLGYGAGGLGRKSARLSPDTLLRMYLMLKRG